MCELCNLEKKTKWYYEDENYIICDCLTCRPTTLMVVSKDHNFKVEVDTFHHAVLFGIVKGVVGGERFTFRKERRKVKDHFHWHIIFEDH